MPALTDAACEAALTRFPTSGKTVIALSDAGRYGQGRLQLIIRRGRADWYAVSSQDGRRVWKRLGDYPAMGLADARRAYQALRGAEIAGPDGAPPRFVIPDSLAALFAGYVASLRRQGKPTAGQIERMLEIAADALGRDRRPAEVTTDDIVGLLRGIYQRGAAVNADKFRGYIGAAFRWAMRSTHDYRVAGARDWGVKVNPVAVIPRDLECQRVGDRWLPRADFDALLEFCQQRPGRARQAIALVMLTGQRVREILALRADQWDAEAGVLSWAKTKNGKPHAIPVCRQAARILESIQPNEHGLLFPSARHADRPMPDGTALVFVKAWAKRRGIPAVTPRDLRRTWKTLAGEAGLTKAERDMLQNHSRSDVSSRHYDRWEYMPEKRAAVVKWEAWLRQPQRDRLRVVA